VARRRAADAGADITFVEGDAGALPFPDASFDRVTSVFGAIFAPDHERVAHELARVTKPGGRLGLSAWDPTGAVGEMFQLLGKFQPPPPEGAGKPSEWGREEYARELLESTFDLRFVHGVNYNSEPGEEAWELMKTNFGPMKTLHDMLDEERRKELRDEYICYVDKHTQNGTVPAPGEYLLILGRRR
jgi:ubiquinone/menaquinone biosynthesis C-methylase UbiE